MPDAPARPLGPVRLMHVLRDKPMLAILAVALLVRVAWVLHVPNHQWSDVACYDDAARSLATTGQLDFGAACHHYKDWFPPGWPLFLAPFYRVFGAGHDVFKWVNIALALFTVYGTIAIGTRLFDRRTGLLGGLAMALLPGQVVYVSLAQYEVFLTALMVALLWSAAILAAHMRAGSPRSIPGWAFIVGLILSWAVLTRPPLVLLPIVLFWFFARAGGSWRRAWLPGAIVAVCVMVTTLAWMARNHAVLGERVLFSTNGGYNLWHGNNPNATGGAMTPPRDTKDIRLNPELIPGELANNRQSLEFAKAYIKADPARFVRMMPRRVWHLFNTDTTGLYLSFIYAPLAVPTALESWKQSPLPEAVTFRAYALVMLLALGGLGLAPWRKPQVALCGALMLYWVAGAAVTFGQDRYRMPLMPVFCLFAAYTVVRLSACRGKS